MSSNEELLEDIARFYFHFHDVKEHIKVPTYDIVGKKGLEYFYIKMSTAVLSYVDSLQCVEKISFEGFTKY